MGEVNILELKHPIVKESDKDDRDRKREQDPVMEYVMQGASQLRLNGDVAWPVI